MIIGLTLLTGNAGMIPLKHLIGRQWGAGFLTRSICNQAEFDVAKATDYQSQRALNDYKKAHHA